jgi:hypothetical protein
VPDFELECTKFLETKQLLATYIGPYSGGKHPQMRRDDLTVIIPNPHEGDISVGLLSRLLRQAGVSREEWLGE